jgi:hypothetical protein
MCLSAIVIFARTLALRLLTQDHGGIAHPEECSAADFLVKARRYLPITCGGLAADQGAL